jgi:hypothetical protein
MAHNREWWDRLLCQLSPVWGQSVSVEATAEPENLTNEPTDFWSPIVITSLSEMVFARDPTATSETNEPKFGP